MPRRADPNTRSALVAAARREFTRRGLCGARIEDITSACHLSKGGFYLHFESKEALFGQIVNGLLAGLREAANARDRMCERFAQEGGPVTTEELRRGTPRARRFLAEELELDVCVLDLMWDYRDVIDVLVRGSQGTRFEGLMWEVVDAEVARITEQFKGQSSPRDRVDLPPDLLGSLIVGTHLLLAERMVGLASKPDTRAWAVPLQRLLYEGSPLPSRVVPAPRSRPRRSARASVAPSPRRTEP